MFATLNKELILRASGVLAQLKASGWTMATAESCTGGLIAVALTELPGASKVFDRGFVTYSNQAKIDLLGVPAALIEEHGAVSGPVSRAMAEGARERAGVHIGLSITGIAGPTGGTEEKPVGLVHMACAMQGRPTLHQSHIFQGERSEIRLQAALKALQMIQEGIRL